MMHRRSLVAVVVVVAAAGCASNPALHPSITGQPLVVEVNEKNVTVVEREQLVDLGATNGKGGFLGLDIGRDVERDRVVRSVQLKQGLRVVDEQDFYEIAGDRAALRQVEAHRSGGQLMQAGGVGALGIGAAALAGGTAAIAFGFAQPNGLGMDGAMPWVMGGFFAGIMPGGLAAGIGYALFTSGAERLEPDQMLLPVDRAQAAAQAYNAELAGGAGAAVVSVR